VDVAPSGAVGEEVKYQTRLPTVAASPTPATTKPVFSRPTALFADAKTGSPGGAEQVLLLVEQAVRDLPMPDKN
jgi:hypothetical protein